MLVQKRRFYLAIHNYLSNRLSLNQRNISNQLNVNKGSKALLKTSGRPIGKCRTLSTIALAPSLGRLQLREPFVLFFF